MRDASASLEIGFRLDRRWHGLRGEMASSKQQTIEALVDVLTGARIPYALIGGIAVQIHGDDPRTTLDVDVAVLDRAAIPRAALAAAGFARTGEFAHAENWRGPDGTPVPFSDDPALQHAVRAAEPRSFGARTLRVVSRPYLLRAKLRAAADPARRRSKRLMDLADAQALLERTPALADTLTADERALLRLPGEP